MTNNAFLTLLYKKLGLCYRNDDFLTPFDELAGWDSVYVLRLLAVVNSGKNQSISLAQLLAANNLEELCLLVSE